MPLAVCRALLQTWRRGESDQDDNRSCVMILHWPDGSGNGPRRMKFPRNALSSMTTTTRSICGHSSSPANRFASTGRRTTSSRTSSTIKSTGTAGGASWTSRPAWTAFLIFWSSAASGWANSSINGMRPYEPTGPGEGPEEIYRGSAFAECSSRCPHMRARAVWAFRRHRKVCTQNYVKGRDLARDYARIFAG